jgi:glycosyltransferase involved in cell wall biosynthesis
VQFAVGLPIRLILGVLEIGPIRYSFFLFAGFVWVLRLNPRVIHCHDLNVLLIGALHRLLTRSVVIYDSHEIFTEKVAAQKLKGFWRALEGLLVTGCESIIVTTELRAEVFKELHPLVKSPVVLHNYPAPMEDSPLDIREEAGLPPDAFVALYQGGIQEHRGLETIIESVSFLKGVYVVFQGDGPLVPKIRGLVELAPKKDFIRVLRGRPYHELRRFTGSASVGLQLLHPFSLNHTTTLSNKLFEYLLFGLPVVASDFPLIRAVLTEKRAGILVDPCDPVEIAQAINRIHQNPEEAEQLSQNALRASGAFAWNDEKVELLRLYRDLS